MTQLRVGVDLGGTKTEIIVLSGASEELYRKRIATHRDDYPRTLNDIEMLLNEAEAAVGVANIPLGLGIPGTVSRKTGRVKNANSTWLNGRSEEHTSELQSRPHLVCRLLLEKKKK